MPLALARARYNRQDISVPTFITFKYTGTAQGFTALGYVVSGAVKIGSGFEATWDAERIADNLAARWLPGRPILQCLARRLLVKDQWVSVAPC